MPLEIRIYLIGELQSMLLYMASSLVWCVLSSRFLDMIHGMSQHNSLASRTIDWPMAWSRLTSGSCLDVASTLPREHGGDFLAYWCGQVLLPTVSLTSDSCLDVASTFPREHTGDFLALMQTDSTSHCLIHAKWKGLHWPFSPGRHTRLLLPFGWDVTLV